MTDFKEEGFQIDPLDLKNDVSPGTEDDHRVYNHDGTSTLTLTDGSTTSKKGWYMWSDPDNAWFPMGQHADLVDGYHGTDLAVLAENQTVSGTWDFGSGINITGGSLSIGGTSTLSSTELSNIKAWNTLDNDGDGVNWRLVEGSTSGDFFLKTDNGTSKTTQMRLHDSGNLDIPNGGASISGNTSITGTLDATGVLNANGNRVHEGDHNPVSIPVTKWAAGLSSEEVHRISVPTGKSLYVYGLEIAVKGGGGLATPSNLTIDVYDATNATVVASDSANGSMSTGSPIGSSGSGAEVLFRLSNSSGSYQNASIQANVVIK